MEANLLLDVKHAGHEAAISTQPSALSKDTPGHLRISRTFTLKNRILVRGTVASAEISVQDPEVVVIHRALGGVPVSETLRLENFPGGSSYWRQLDNFVPTIANPGKPDADVWPAGPGVGL